jgi:hypothetical protein
MIMRRISVFRLNRRDGVAFNEEFGTDLNLITFACSQGTLAEEIIEHIKVITVSSRDVEKSSPVEWSQLGMYLETIYENRVETRLVNSLR